MKKSMKVIALATFTSVMLAGCFDEETKTVEYYETHPEEYENKLAECNNNPGELESTPNCKNVRQVQAKKITGRGKDMSKW